MKRLALAISGLSLLAITPSVSAAPAVESAQSLSPQLGPNARALYAAVFADIDAGRWIDAGLKLDAMPVGSLHVIARSAIYLGKNSPKIEGDRLSALIDQAPYLPDAPALARLARARGAEALPELPRAQALSSLGVSPRRTRTSSIEGDAAATALGTQLNQFIKDDRPADAEAMLAASIEPLSPEYRTEWQQRVSWSYFIVNDDANARRLASIAQVGVGPWAAQASWVVGLSAWRQHDWSAASAAFSQLAARSADPEMASAGHYWAARADMVRGRADLVQPHLRAAARATETFYGMLSQGAMGLPAKQDDPDQSAIARAVTLPNVRAAIALHEIDQDARAEELLRWQARIGVPSEHGSLIAIAGKLNLPATQLWLGQYGPAGSRTTIGGRYPMAGGWSPEGGWRVDRALILAHALQESGFRTTVVSAAGARGLMQVRQGTANDIARKRGAVFTGSLNSPATNMEYGQSYIEQLRDMAQTGGLLPKVIAAYNAGPAPLDRWNLNPAANRDPLLYIESIPYWETRGYVTTVLRNYWVYQQQAGDKVVSRTALIQGNWPRFPGLATASATRFQR